MRVLKRIPKNPTNQRQMDQRSCPLIRSIKVTTCIPFKDPLPRLRKPLHRLANIHNSDLPQTHIVLTTQFTRTA